MSRSANHLDRRGLAWGVVGVAVVIALTFIGSDRLVWWGKCWLGDVIVDYHYDYRSATCVITFFPE